MKESGLLQMVSQSVGCVDSMFSVAIHTNIAFVFHPNLLGIDVGSVHHQLRVWLHFNLYLLKSEEGSAICS